MKLPLYQVDAFTDQIFAGNPAAVVPLESWLPDETLQKIAMENNLAETAFFVPTEKSFHLRWFTPTVEAPLCGHATLATAFVLYTQLGYEHDEIVFKYMSGELRVRREKDGYVLNFPVSKISPAPIPQDLPEVIDANVLEYYTAEESIFSLVLTEKEQDVTNAKPDFLRLMNIEPGNFILMAPSEEYDFVSRVFVPEHGIPEDPVTGSAHCVSVPYWAEKLGKNVLSARQVSARGGDILCTLIDERLDMFGKAVLYLKGEITI